MVRRPHNQVVLRVLACVVTMCAVLACFGASIATAAEPTNLRHDASEDVNQVTITWTTATPATTEIVWDDVRHANFDAFPASHVMSGSQLGTTHSRTLSFLSSGTYFYVARSRAANGSVVAVSAVKSFVVDEEAEGSLKRIVMSGDAGADGMRPAKITASASRGATTYIAGNFRRVGTRTGHGVIVQMGGSQAGNHANALQKGTPLFNGDVRVSISDGAGGWFVGGAFTRVGGLPRNGLARILPDGGVDPNFNAGTGFRNPGGTGVVEALALDTVNASMLGGNRLYVGGGFRTFEDRVVNNIVALRASDGSYDGNFNLRRGANIGADAPVYAIKTDRRALTAAGRTDDHADYSGVYVGGAFSHIAGMKFDRVAKLELNGNRSKWRKPLPVDGSIEWTIIQDIVGEDSFVTSGQFESCAISQDTACAPADDSTAATIQLPAPVTSVAAINLSDPRTKVVTSLASYNQAETDPNSTASPKESCVLATLPPVTQPAVFETIKNIPVIGYFLALTNLISAVTNKQSSAHAYMVDWAYRRVSSIYDETLILGGRFGTKRHYQFIDEASDVQSNITGLDAATGTAQLDNADNPGLARLEHMFPSLGKRLRDDAANNNFRFNETNLRGVIHSFAVDDQPGCGNDRLFVGGDFVNLDAPSQADLATIKLDPGYGRPWKVRTDALVGAIHASPVSAADIRAMKADPELVVDGVEDGREVASLQLDQQSSQIFAAGNYLLDDDAARDRTLISSFATTTGATVSDDAAGRDGVDGRIATFSMSGSGSATRAFVGGEFTTFDSYARPGIAALRTEEGDESGEIDVDTTFRPSRAPAGTVTSMTTTARQVFVGGPFGFGAYRRAAVTGDSLQPGTLDPVVGVAGRVNGEVRALHAMGENLVIGGAFTRYAGTLPGNRTFGCDCRNVVVVNDTLGLPVGIRPATGTTGQLTGDYQYALLGLDGPVNAIAARANRLYLGGAFHRAGGDSSERGGLVAVNATDGTLDRTFHARAGGTDGHVNALIATDDYVIAGGRFDHYRGRGVKNVVRVDRLTGELDEQFADATDASPLATGEVRDLNLSNNILFATGGFNGVAAVDAWTGTNVPLPPTEADDDEAPALGSIGNHPLIGGQSTITLEAVADVDAPRVSTSVTSEHSIVTGPDGTRYYNPQGTFTVHVTAFDVATFAQAESGNKLVSGLRAIQWPQISGAVVSEDPFDAEAHRGLRVSCSDATGHGVVRRVASLPGRTGGDAFADVQEQLEGTATCTLRGFVIVPSDLRSADLQVALDGAANAKASFGDPVRVQVNGNSTGRIPTATNVALPVTINWSGAPNTLRDLRLRWLSDGADLRNDWVPIPAAMLVNQITFSRTYDLSKTTATTAPSFDVRASDGSLQTPPRIPTAVAGVADVVPPVLGAIRIGNGFGTVATGSIKLDIAAATDNAGAPRMYLYRRTAPFMTSGDAVCDITKATQFARVQELTAADLGGKLTPAITRNQCAQYKVVAVDFALQPTSQSVNEATDWVYEVTATGGATLAPSSSVLEGAEARVGGSVDTSGAGIFNYAIQRRAGGAWSTVCASPSNGDVPACTTSVDGDAWGTALDSFALGDGAQTFRVTGADRLGRDITREFPAVRVDNVGPQVAPLAFAPVMAEGERSRVALDTGDVAPVLWFNPNVAGAFNVTTSVTDDGQGMIAPTVAGLKQGWSTDAGSVDLTRIVPGTPTAYTRTFSWAAGAGAPDPIELRVTETGGKSSVRNVVVQGDGVVPKITVGAATVGAVETEGGETAEPQVADARRVAAARRPAAAFAKADAAPVSRMITVPISLDDEGRSGVEGASFLRRVGKMTKPDTCDDAVWSEPSAEVPVAIDATNVTDTALEDGHCYRYSVVAVDRVGNGSDDPVVSKLVRVGNIEVAVPPSKVTQPEATTPVPVTPLPVTPSPVIRDKPIGDEPTPEAPAPTKERVVPITQEPAAPRPQQPQVIRVEAPKPQVQKRLVPRVIPATPAPVVEQRVASTPEPQVDQSWVERSVDWVKEHKLEAGALGAGAVHLGGTLLYGKGLGAMLSNLLNHLNVPFGAVRRLALHLWKRRGRAEEETEDEDDDEGEGEGDDDRWSDVPSTYRPAA